MPKRHALSANQRAGFQFGREMYAAAKDALAALAEAEVLTGRAKVEAAREALAFLVEQSEEVLANLKEPSDETAPYIDHVKELHRDLDWLHPVAGPIVYIDGESGGAFVEALIWVDDEDVGLDADADDLDDLDDEDDFDDEDEDEDEDEDDFEDEE